MFTRTTHFFELFCLNLSFGKIIDFVLWFCFSLSILHIKKCLALSIQIGWKNVRNPQFYPWVRPVKDSLKKPMCCICNKTFALTNIGKSATKTRMQSEKCKQNTHSESPIINSFFKRSTSITAPSSSVSSRVFLATY